MNISFLVIVFYNLSFPSNNSSIIRTICEHFSELSLIYCCIYFTGNNDLFLLLFLLSVVRRHRLNLAVNLKYAHGRHIVCTLYRYSSGNVSKNKKDNSCRFISYVYRTYTDVIPTQISISILFILYYIIL